MVVDWGANSDGAGSWLERRVLRRIRDPDADRPASRMASFPKLFYLATTPVCRIASRNFVTAASFGMLPALVPIASFGKPQRRNPPRARDS